MSLVLQLPDEPATEALARRAARSIPQSRATQSRADQSGQPLVLYLHGDLGAGKTCLARGMLRELGESGPVRSPTYGLLTEYPLPGGVVVHMDLYRLRGPEELAALGLADAMAGSTLWLIEWPERAQGTGLPKPDAQLWLEPDGEGRRLRIEAVTERGSRWLDSLRRQ